MATEDIEQPCERHDRYPCWSCMKSPSELPRLIPSWRFVVPETSDGTQPGIPVISCTPPPVEGTYDPDLQEARIHQVLSPDELEDR